MPLIDTGAATLHYDLTGPEGAPVILFSNSLGTKLEMWDGVVAKLVGRWRCLRYDTRGHGRSPVVENGATPTHCLEDLADDVAGLLKALNIQSAHIVGLSLGGMTAQAFGARHPGMTRTLTLMATGARLEPVSAWVDRAAKVRASGMEWLVEPTMNRWFTPSFHASHPEAVAECRRIFAANTPAGYAACCDAISVMDLRESNKAITAPTLIIAGANDEATPPALSVEMQDRIPGSELVILPDAAHLLASQHPALVADYLEAFLLRHEPQPAQKRAGGPSFEEGLANRKSVLGAEHVERSLAKAGSFAMPWQDFITRTAWGEIWGDETLPRKTRSIITLAMMVGLHREEEFKLHVRPALKNGVTIPELQSLLMQTAIYGGVPAANAAFRWVREVLGDELD
jgi:3-oxoadipate enol-lactonase/4-carboxymuconolactone decarboxylase